MKACTTVKRTALLFKSPNFRNLLFFTESPVHFKELASVLQHFQDVEGGSPPPMECFWSPTLQPRGHTMKAQRLKVGLGQDPNWNPHSGRRQPGRVELRSCKAPALRKFQPRRIFALRRPQPCRVPALRGPQSCRTTGLRRSRLAETSPGPTQAPHLTFAPAPPAETCGRAGSRARGTGPGGASPSGLTAARCTRARSALTFPIVTGVVHGAATPPH